MSENGSKLQQNIAKIIEKYNDIGDKLVAGNISSEEIVSLGKERSSLEAVAEMGKDYLKVVSDIAELEDAILLEPEMKAVIEEELRALNSKKKQMEDDIKMLLIPKDEQDARNVIIEIRAGAGGDEASLFGTELLDVYRKFASSRGWSFEMLSTSLNDIGGLKEGVCTVSGRNVFETMKFESGTHRVQRVPKTENKGRVHTSTVTVAVLPEAEEIDLKISDKDIRIDVFRASGPGGQSVNTTDSAVRMVHLPTGITVSQQDEKSQIKNKEKARKILLSKIYEHEKRKQEEELSKERNGQIGSGDRSEKIRTYNFPQDRITDHRIGENFGLTKMLAEGKIGEIVDKLLADSKLKKLSELEL